MPHAGGDNGGAGAACTNLRAWSNMGPAASHAYKPPPERSARAGSSAALRARNRLGVVVAPARARTARLARFLRAAEVNNSVPAGGRQEEGRKKEGRANTSSLPLAPPAVGPKKRPVSAGATAQAPPHSWSHRRRHCHSPAALSLQRKEGGRGWEWATRREGGTEEDSCDVSSFFAYF